MEHVSACAYVHINFINGHVDLLYVGVVKLPYVYMYIAKLKRPVCLLRLSCKAHREEASRFRMEPLQHLPQTHRKQES